MIEQHNNGIAIGAGALGQAATRGQGAGRAAPRQISACGKAGSTGVDPVDPSTPEGSTDAKELDWTIVRRQQAAADSLLGAGRTLALPLALPEAPSATFAFFFLRLPPSWRTHATHAQRGWPGKPST